MTWWRLRTLIPAARARLPQGGRLSAHAWTARHSGIVLLLWAHVAALFVIGLVRGSTVTETVAASAIVALFTGLAMRARLGRAARSSLATLGLLSSSAILIYLFDGLVEAHFHFFITIAVVALYQAWTPYLIAVAFVLFHHLVLGTLVPGQVYNHHAAVHNPWVFAVVHASAVLAESIALLIYWRANETALNGERQSRQELEQVHRDLESAQELAGVGSWGWEPELDVMTWSEQHYALAGVDDSTFTPTLNSFLGLVHIDDVTTLTRRLTRACEDQTPIDVEYRLVRPDGSIRRVHTLAELQNGTDDTPTRFLGTFQDVTERRESEQRLADLVGMLSHDLRTPLSVVIGYSELALESWSAADDEAQQGFIRKVNVAGRSVETLLEDTLTVSALDARGITAVPRAVRVDEAVREVLAGLPEKLSEIDLADLGAATACVDRGHLTQVLTNLISNAAKYGEAPYAIRSREDGDTVRVTVRDSGAGISDEFASRMFERYSRSDDARVGRARGTGLGLYIVRSLLTANEGDISYERPSGGGSAFTIELPRASPIERDSTAAVAPL